MVIGRDGAERRELLRKVQRQVNEYCFYVRIRVCKKKTWPDVGTLSEGLHDCMSLCQHCILEGVSSKPLFMDYQTGFFAPSTSI